MADRCGNCSNYNSGRCMIDGHDVDKYDDACRRYED